MAVDNVFLPGTIQDRIQKLMKEHRITQSELAARIDCSDSTLSRFLTGKTERFGTEYIVRIARVFNVSTDFLLGNANPDRKSYEIAELGLSTQAARNLYTRTVNADVLNRLLENPCFAELTYMLGQYFTGEMAKRLAGMSHMYNTMSSMMWPFAKDTSAQVSRTVNGMKAPAYQADLPTIQNQFVEAIKEVQKEIGCDLAATQNLTKNFAQKMLEEWSKGQEMLRASMMPGAAASKKPEEDDPFLLNKFGQSMAEFMRAALMLPDEKGRK